MIAAWGSRGDLQPVAALAVQLKKEGREVLVFATPPATNIIIENGINCVVAKENVETFVEKLFGQTNPSDRSISGLLKLAKFGKEYLNDPKYIALQKDDMLNALSTAKEFSPDVLVVPNIIYGPYVSIAEKLNIPLVTFDLQINHPTSNYPLFTMEIGKFPSFLNLLFYKVKAFAYKKTIQSKFEMMRKVCGLPIDKYTNGTKFNIWPHLLPQICAFSPTLCPEPKDWSNQKFMSGWWFLSNNKPYTPPTELIKFLKQKPVYIGFGSMKGNPTFCKMLSTLAIKSLHLAGVKGVLLGGWAGLTRHAIDTSTKEGKLLQLWAEKNVYEIDSCPHEWLFNQCRAVIHHGGAGTLAAGIRANCPTIVCATQGDQPFNGSIVKNSGIGKYLGMIGSKTVTAQTIATSIQEVTTNDKIIATSKSIGDKVKSEEGVVNAINFIDRMTATFSYPWPIKTRPND